MYNIQGLKTIALYRVSTDKQTSQSDEKDIPAQQELVKQFIEREELNLVKEFLEGGVSGYKVKIEDRDALVSIKKMAIAKAFSVLLVYKADRIGRTSSECPIIIQFLNQHGIRIFTTDGTELKSDTQNDKLLTWLTFWQNETESVKISERSTDYHIIQIMNGKYRGGGEYYLPFGYNLIKEGDVNLKGKKIGKLIIDNEKAEIVKLIYKLSIDNNMGNRAIASYLNENRYKTYARNQNGWNYTSIGHILQNKIYKGYLSFNSAIKKKEFLSPQLEDLIIIPEHIWDKNQMIIKNRTTKQNKDIKGSTVSHVLLSGLVYCGHCNQKMHVWANHKCYINKDGQNVKYIQYYYKCKSSYVKNRIECDGQSAYSANRIDNMIETKAKNHAKYIGELLITDKGKEKIKQKILSLNNSKEELIVDLNELNKSKNTLIREISLVSRGKSTWKKERLDMAIDLTEQDIKDKENEISQINIDIKEYELKNDLYEEMSSFGDRYDNADFLGRKSMLNKIIKKVFIYKNDNHVDWKLTPEELGI